MPCFNLTMTHEGWNAFEHDLHAAFPHPTPGVSCLYGQRAHDGAWVRIFRAWSAAGIANRWTDDSNNYGFRGCFNQIAWSPYPPQGLEWLNWTCFFWQLTRLSGQQPAQPYPGMNFAPLAQTTTQQHLLHFPACNAWRAMLPTTYFLPVFKVCVHAAGSPACDDRAIAALPAQAGQPMATRRHLDVRQKCNAWINAHPDFTPPE